MNGTKRGGGMGLNPVLWLLFWVNLNCQEDGVLMCVRARRRRKEIIMALIIIYLTVWLGAGITMAVLEMVKEDSIVVNIPAIIWLVMIPFIPWIAHWGGLF